MILIQWLIARSLKIAPALGSKSPTKWSLGFIGNLSEIFLEESFVILFYISGLTAQNSQGANPKLQSMVLPGWGEQSLGETQRANGFFIREAALWITYFGSSKAAGWYASDYNAFAELHSCL